MGSRDKRQPSGEHDKRKPSAPPRADQDEAYDETVADTFPASDPPASSGIIGPGREDRKPADK